MGKMNVERWWNWNGAGSGRAREVACWEESLSQCHCTCTERPGIEAVRGRQPPEPKTNTLRLGYTDQSVNAV